jgi:hypothetical protein
LKVLDVKVTEVIAGDMCNYWCRRFEIGDTIADETQKV